MRYYLTQDHFHYDDSGYYGYILFSGTPSELHELLGALGRGEKPHGFGWHRYGRSFRPANNGIVYDYYIRLRTKTEKKPTQEKVDEFLQQTLPPRHVLSGEEILPPEDDEAQTEPSAAPALTRDVPPLWADQLLSHVGAMNQKNIESLTQIMNEKMLGVLSVLGDIAAAQGEIHRLQANLVQTREELEAKDAELEAKQAEIETLRAAPRAGSYNKQLQEEKDKAEKAAKRLREDIKNQRVEKNDQIADLKATLREAEQERDKWKRQFADLSESYKEQSDDEQAPVEDEDKYEGDLFHIVKGAFPQLELVHNSWVNLPKVPHFRPVMALLYQVHNREARGERIPDTDWSELRFSKAWRLYYCNKTNLPQGKIVALIGNKNTQPDDIRWLKDRSPESCL